MVGRDVACYFSNLDSSTKLPLTQTILKLPPPSTQNRPDGKLPSGGSWLLSLRGCIVPLRPHQEGSILDEFSPRVKEKPPDSSRHKDSCFLRTASLLVSMGQVKEVDMNEIIFLVEPDPVGG